MNIDRLKKKQEEIALRKEGYRKDFWFPKEGMNTIRFMPHWSGDLESDCWCETMYHKGIGPDKKTLVCIKFQLKEECPICVAVDAMFKTKDKEDIAYAKKLVGKRRIYWNIVDLKEPEKGVQVWMTGTDIQDTVIDYCTNPKWGDITNPFTGRNVDIKFTPKEKTKSGYNEYVVTPEPSASEIGNPEWLAKMTDLTTFIKLTPAAEMGVILYGEDQEQATATTAPEYRTVTPAVTHAAPAVLPTEPHPLEKPCFKNAKFSNDDEECLACLLNAACQEKRIASKRAREAVLQQSATGGIAATEPQVVKQEPLKSVVAKETEIANMLAQIKAKSKK